MEELSGIFNWAIVGLRRLRNQGGFTRSAVGEVALREYRQESNPARTFLDENCLCDAQRRVPCKNVYAAYTEWCRECGYRPLDEAQFGKEVKRAVPNGERRRPRERDERVYRYEGLAMSEGRR